MRLLLADTDLSSYLPLALIVVMAIGFDVGPHRGGGRFAGVSFGAGGRRRSAARPQGRRDAHAVRASSVRLGDPLWKAMPYVRDDHGLRSRGPCRLLAGIQDPANGADSC